MAALLCVIFFASSATFAVQFLISTAKDAKNAKNLLTSLGALGLLAVYILCFLYVNNTSKDAWANGRDEAV